MIKIDEKFPPGLIIHTSLYGEEVIKKFMKKKVIGRNSGALGFQPLEFENIPLVFCSYYSGGYPFTYGNFPGITFETDSPVAYACPCDTFNLIRGGNWLAGNEQFIFHSLEEMLKKYPNMNAFKKDFKEYFERLKPEEVYPNNDKKYAEYLYGADYCLKETWKPGCNEITFRKPLKIKNPVMFNSEKELWGLIK